MTIPTDDLIPCTSELNRLKEFLADFKRPTRWVMERQEIEWKVKWSNYQRNAKVRAENRQGWIDAVKGGAPFPKNCGGPYKTYWTWAGGRITPKY